MPIHTITPSTKVPEFTKVGIVQARFNPAIGELELKGSLRALAENGVLEKNIILATVPGALEIPLMMLGLIENHEVDAVIALGAVIKGDTYHFEVVCNESARGISQVGLDTLTPVGNGVLTTYTEEQALSRAEQKGYEAALAALELLNSMDAE
jgi:6,7-dimethyl-8-ribityllumazine synthase